LTTCGNKTKRACSSFERHEKYGAEDRKVGSKRNDIKTFFFFIGTTTKLLRGKLGDGRTLDTEGMREAALRAGTGVLSGSPGRIGQSKEDVYAYGRGTPGG